MEDSDLGPLSQFSGQVEGEFVITFTARLPFTLGIPNQLGHTISFGAPFVSREAGAVFGPRAFVNIRVFNLEQSGLRTFYEQTIPVLEHFYSYRPDANKTPNWEDGRLKENEQWVTLETPFALLTGENVSDKAFAFHRSLQALNLFLRAVLVITKDTRIRSVSSHDLRPVVIIGAVQKGEPWRFLSEMLMHPEALPERLFTPQTTFSNDDLRRAIAALAANQPYLTTLLWRSRAQRALRYSGDASDAVISFQVAAESMLFDTYRLILVDEGRSSTEVSAEVTDLPFKTLLTTKMPAKLGGQWDVTRPSTAVGDYWQRLYVVRNLIVHSGIQAHGGHAEQAQTVYWGLRDHIEHRLWAKHNIYPRTLLARVGEEQLVRRGWLTKSMRALIEKTKTDPGPFYAPHDQRRIPHGC